MSLFAAEAVRETFPAPLSPRGLIHWPQRPLPHGKGKQWVHAWLPQQSRTSTRALRWELSDWQRGKDFSWHLKDWAQQEVNPRASGSTIPWDRPVVVRHPQCSNAKPTPPCILLLAPCARSQVYPSASYRSYAQKTSYQESQGGKPET